MNVVETAEEGIGVGGEELFDDFARENEGSSKAGVVVVDDEEDEGGPELDRFEMGLEGRFGMGIFGAPPLLDSSAETDRRDGNISMVRAEDDDG